MNTFIGGATLKYTYSGKLCKVQNTTKIGPGAGYNPSTSKPEVLKSCTLEMNVVSLKMKKKTTAYFHRALYLSLQMQVHCFCIC